MTDPADIAEHRKDAEYLARRRATPPAAEPVVDRVREALQAVADAMLNGGDGEVGDFGWNITKLNKARPLIRAALASPPAMRECTNDPCIASAPARGEVERLREALIDDPNWIAAGIPNEAIKAGIDAWDAAKRSMANCVSGETVDWDEGMIVAAIFKAVGRTLLSPNHPERAKEEEDFYAGRYAERCGRVLELETEVATLRDQVIEECAAVAEGWCGTMRAAGCRDKVGASIAIATALRNLKGTRP